MQATPYPLMWPDKFPRTKAPENSRFNATLSKAMNNVAESLRLFASDSGKKLENLVISSNVSLGEGKPKDSGVAAWFTWDGLTVCVAVDRYKKVEDNLQAIHHIIEARRVELRHGTLALVRASFTGFRALPAPKKPDWWEVLGVAKDASRAAITKAYHDLSREHHPDKGGSQEKMTELTAAYKAAVGEA